MLVLTRKINEAIMIGDDIEIAVVDIKGDQVKLGIRAPRSVKVFRHEVYDAIQEENRRAAQSAGELPSLGDFPPAAGKDRGLDKE
jgi:carbon storage regulator